MQKHQQMSLDRWALHLCYIVQVEQECCSPLEPVLRDHMQREGILPPVAKQSLRNAQSKCGYGKYSGQVYERHPNETFSPSLLTRTARI